MTRTALPRDLLLASCSSQTRSPYPTVSVGDLPTALGSGVTLADVRPPAGSASGHIASAVNLPLGQVQALTGEVPANRPVYVIGHGGNRSAQASASLKKAGRDVRNVGAGMIAWTAARYPTTPRPGDR